MSRPQPGRALRQRKTSHTWTRPRADVRTWGPVQKTEHDFSKRSVRLRRREAADRKGWVGGTRKRPPPAAATSAALVRGPALRRLQPMQELDGALGVSGGETMARLSPCSTLIQLAR